jgi:hypothetical protein
MNQSILTNWANAIQKYEGWYIGSRSYKNNNPGNITYDAAIQLGMVGVTGSDGGSPNMAIFDTYENGFAGLELYITKACSGTWGLYPPGTTFLQFCNIYAGNPSNNYINGIASEIGCNTNDIISAILNGTFSSQGEAIPDLNPDSLIVTPAVITLGGDSSDTYKFVVQQGTYERTWVRYTNSNAILGTGGQYINMIDNGVGTNSYTFTIICRNWDSNSSIVKSGVPADWKTQKINLEKIYGQTGTAHTFIDPFGQNPRQGLPGVYITNLEETIDSSSTPDSPCTLYAVTLLQAPFGSIIDTPTLQAIQPPAPSNLMAVPVIALGLDTASGIQLFAIKQGSYSRKWSRYNSSTSIPGSPKWLSYVDYGPGINEYDVTIICRNWEPTSLPYLYGVTQSWAQQKSSIENMYNKTNTAHFFLDAFGQYPTQDSTKGVYIVKLSESVDVSSTPSDPVTYFDLVLLQTPPGVNIE